MGGGAFLSSPIRHGNHSHRIPVALHGQLAGEDHRLRTLAHGLDVDQAQVAEVDVLEGGPLTHNGGGQTSRISVVVVKLITLMRRIFLFDNADDAIEFREHKILSASKQTQN